MLTIHSMEIIASHYARVIERHVQIDMLQQFNMAELTDSTGSVALKAESLMMGFASIGSQRANSSYL